MGKKGTERGDEKEKMEGGGMDGRMDGWGNETRKRGGDGWDTRMAIPTSIHLQLSPYQLSNPILHHLLKAIYPRV